MPTWSDTDADGVVLLPDGGQVRGTGVRRPRGDVPPPTFAVYLLPRDPDVTAWPSRWVRWPDFRLPASTEQAVDVLRVAHELSTTERVEVACGGGVGRTGTALALLAVLGGVRPDDAVDWVRAAYHPRAVETPWQRRWVRRVGAGLT